jgi:hypothetical protein
MADWATISSLATAGGTLFLAVATFASATSTSRPEASGSGRERCATRRRTSTRLWSRWPPSARAFSIDLLYTDQHGGQRTISRFAITPTSEERWLASVVRHWTLDTEGPRPIV